MKTFTFKQGEQINQVYKRNLAIVNRYLKNKEVNSLSIWLVKKADYCISIENKTTQAIEFTALAYALKCYKEIADYDLHSFLDTWINHITRYVNTMLTGIYKEKFNEWIGVK